MSNLVFNGYHIVTDYWPKPIPMRQFDWEAVTEDYQGGDPIGHGKTEAAAVKDLLEQLEDKEAEKIAAPRGLTLAAVIGMAIWVVILCGAYVVLA